MARRKRTLENIQDYITQDLALQDVKTLQRWLTAHLNKLEREEENWEPPVNEDTVEVRRIGKSCFCLQGVKCGKAGCKCASGKLHGPYWYEYWRDGSKVKKKYHGKQIKTGESQVQASSISTSSTVTSAATEATAQEYSYEQPLKILLSPYSEIEGWSFVSELEGGQKDGWIECFNEAMQETRNFPPHLVEAL